MTFYKLVFFSTFYLGSTYRWIKILLVLGKNPLGGCFL